MTTNTPTTTTRLYACGAVPDQMSRLAEETDVAKRIRQLTEAQANIEAATIAEIRVWREAGATWQQVGDALGVTRQAAQQRFRRGF